MRALCPACQADHPLPTFASPPPRCSRCQAELLIDGKHALIGQGAGQAHDEVDGAVPIREGEDITTRTPVAIRLAPTDATARLEREATILRGLSLPQVPRVLALCGVSGVGKALVLSHPPGKTLEAQLVEGLRTNADGARRLAEGLLRILVQLHALSPPVFHRNIHPGSIFWDQGTQVHLWDFARATDTADDHQADLVLPRPGFHPTNGTHDPVQLELYGVGATLLHVLSRKSPDQLPIVDGIPDFRGAVQVDDGLAGFMERLLSAGTRRAFASAQEALDGLRPTSSRTAGSGTPAKVFAASALAFIGGGVYVAFNATSHQEPPPPVMEAPAIPPTPPTPPAPSAPRHHRLHLTTEPSHAEVLIDGIRVGHTPIHRTFTVAKSVEVTVRAKDHAPHTQTVHVEDNTALHFTLTPVDKAPAAPTPPPVVAKSDDGLAKQLHALLEAQRARLEACNTDGLDRVRVRVELDGRGKVASTEPMGRGKLNTTRCVMDVIKGLDVPSGARISVDVWVYLQPSFKIAVY